MSVERRKHMRFNAAINGEFRIRGSDISGLLTTDNFSKGGFRAVINRKIFPEAVLDCELTFPESIMPFFSTGKVIWVKEENGDNAAFRYNAGIVLQEIDFVERQTLIDYCYKRWNTDLKNTGKTEFVLEQ